ncbi:hypothetical protein [Arsenophonus nasoniae]|uniref:Uncharacterized protein n=1 Tax=Arsenophonus nasoniae TaxID=638 RepID=A0A4P7L7A8_9GAMM|nr:hypothetical protein [Arsenophonus nasoniae]QBY46890.1 hypothetical protein ArsFIN_55010 [Arsenophonus nasoniae]
MKTTQSKIISLKHKSSKALKVAPVLLFFSFSPVQALILKSINERSTLRVSGAAVLLRGC